MITKNMYTLLRTVLTSSTVVKSVAPMMTTAGVPVFLINQFGKFPYAREESVTLDRVAAGISFGSGTTAPSEDDWNLSRHINSGISASVTAKSAYGENGDTCLKYSITVTNTQSSDITLAEIGYKQPVRAAPFPNATNQEDRVVLLDRTLIEPAITLEPGSATVIDYVLRSFTEPRTVNGVKIVSWQHGSNEEVAAMIDAARVGTIDLRTDGGWKVGDMRTVSIASFVDGRGETHGSASVDLVITSFDEYNGCGNLMQLDFFESLPTMTRMNPSNSNQGGYGLSEMRTVTLPALANAMPEWLTSRMLTFIVTSSAGGNSSEIETVGGNRLALRSEVEIFGTTPGSFEGEGSPVAWYQRDAELRKKRRGRGGGFEWWWTRSPSKDNTRFRTCNNSGNSSYADASNASGQINPFLCI